MNIRSDCFFFLSMLLSYVLLALLRGHLRRAPIKGYIMTYALVHDMYNVLVNYVLLRRPRALGNTTYIRKLSYVEAYFTMLYLYSYYDIILQDHIFQPISSRSKCLFALVTLDSSSYIGFAPELCYFKISCELVRLFINTVYLIIFESGVVEVCIPTFYASKSL